MCSVCHMALVRLADNRVTKDPAEIHHVIALVFSKGFEELAPAMVLGLQQHEHPLAKAPWLVHG